MINLSIKNLIKKYRDEYIFKNFNLKIEKSDFAAIKGASGSGKTTLLNLIAMLDRDYIGDIEIDGMDVKDLSSNEKNKFRSRNIGIVFQNNYLINSLSILENIMLPTKIKELDRLSKEDSKKHIYKLIEELGISHILDKKPEYCSGGEKQRASITRALANNPGLLLADEPTGSLDNDNTIKVGNIFKEINKKYKTTIVLATHDDRISKISDKVILI